MQPATTAEWTWARCGWALALVFGIAGSLEGQDADSTAWMRRPEIRSIRTIVTDVQRAIDDNRMVITDSTVACRGEPSETGYRVFTDSNGVIRRLEEQAASEDHGEFTTYTFDRAGRLRFAFATQAATNGSEAEVRAYWGPDRSLLHQEKRTTKGEGYAWNDIRPIFEPRRALACRE
jgi:hypothetical protein